MYMLEAPFFANRVFWHLTMSGVFDRFPDLVFIMTEQGAGWLPETLQRMDAMHEALAAGKFGELGPSGTALRSRPSEYFARNCYIGASFPSPAEASVIR